MKRSYFFQNVSVWHPEKLSPWSQRAEIPGSLPYIIFVNGSHIVIDGKSQNCITTSKEKFSFLMSHTDALYQSEEIDPLNTINQSLNRNIHTSFWREKMKISFQEEEIKHFEQIQCNGFVKWTLQHCFCVRADLSYGTHWFSSNKWFSPFK